MTRKEHLQKLPLQKRLQAMENIRRDKEACNFNDIMEQTPHIESVLRGAFGFGRTRQGHSYWWNIQIKYFG